MITEPSPFTKTQNHHCSQKRWNDFKLRWSKSLVHHWGNHLKPRWSKSGINVCSFHVHEAPCIRVSFIPLESHRKAIQSLETHLLNQSSISMFHSLGLGELASLHNSDASLLTDRYISCCSWSLQRMVCYSMLPGLEKNSNLMHLQEILCLQKQWNDFFVFTSKGTISNQDNHLRLVHQFLFFSTPWSIML